MLNGLDYLAWQLWPYLVLALLLGFGWGWYACARDSGRDGWHDRDGIDAGREPPRPLGPAGRT